MKLIIHIPMQADREYIEDFKEDVLPKVGDTLDEIYIVKDKKFLKGLCEITVSRNEEWYKRYEIPERNLQGKR